jgi:poly(A) polymerase
MQHLDVPAGPIVGRALKFMLEIRLEEGLVGDEEIRRRLDSWWATQPKSN